METYTAAAERFLKTADYLLESDQPMITGLRHLADELDKVYLASTYAQYGLTFRYLVKQKPGEVDSEDDDPDLGEL